MHFRNYDSSRVKAISDDFDFLLLDKLMFDNDEATARP